MGRGRCNGYSAAHGRVRHAGGGGVSGDLLKLEPWLNKKGLEEYLACSERWIEGRMAEGMPHAKIAGRIKFKTSEVEPWLEENGHMERIA
jgi:hypothetical protein